MNRDEIDAVFRNGFPGLGVVEIEELAEGAVRSRACAPEITLAPNGRVHAGVLVLLADITCGVGCMNGLERATEFATLELKTNFIASACIGDLVCVAQRVHAGRRTEVWDATVAADDGKQLALFRCTQLLLRQC